MAMALGSPLDRRFGPLVLHHDKPLSVAWWACDKAALLKVYRGIEPLARRNRETQALALARRWGIAVPAVRVTGEEAGSCWALIDAVSGTDTPLASPGGVESFVQHMLRLTTALHGRTALGGPGAGWLPTHGNRLTNSGALLQQLSHRCRLQPWWPELAQALTTVDDAPCVYLHGDIKPEHFLPSGRVVHVVDWEAVARGPAVCDVVDAAFHAVRDLIYAQASPLPVDVIAQLPVTGPVAAWRLVCWLDRRRPGDLGLAPADGLRDLLAATTPDTAVRILARLITGLRAAGVPR